VSQSHYELGGLRFWTGPEIMLRRQAVERLARTVQDALTDINPAWRFVETEGPLLTPRRHVSEAYDDDDVWELRAGLGEDDACLRPETTASSYLVARHLLKVGKTRMPLCVWQAGKSFRRETNDGASASRLRFLEFYQQEFQCVYAIGTKADYRKAVLPSVEREIAALTGRPTRVVDSDRLPAYSVSTLDVEVERPDGRWTEMASLSLRTDFAPDAIVLEIALGLDRLVSVAGERPPERA
jgi:glycyl-tRNA synthetase